MHPKCRILSPLFISRSCFKLYSLTICILSYIFWSMLWMQGRMTRHRQFSWRPKCDFSKSILSRGTKSGCPAKRPPSCTSRSGGQRESPSPDLGWFRAYHPASSPTDGWPGAASANRDSPSRLGGQHGGSWRSTHCAITIEAQLPSAWVWQMLIVRQQEDDFMIKAACGVVGK